MIIPEPVAPELITHKLLSIARDGLASDFWHVLDGTARAELKALFREDPVGYQAFRAQVKEANRAINVLTLDQHILGNSKEKGASPITLLVDIVLQKSRLWHNADGEAFISFLGKNDAVQHWKIESSGCRDWLANIAFVELDTPLGSEAMKTVINTLAGQAKFAGEEYVPARRVAKSDEGYWLDVVDDRWQAIFVDSEGWRIVADPPVRFVRTRAMRSLPSPALGGDIEPLWSLLNLDLEDRLLILAWLLECWRPDTPYAVLELTGEQGAAKSTTQTILRGFVDPNQVALRGRPKKIEDIFVASNNAHLVSFENLSNLSADHSDALCAVATGAGFATRQLYTNGEESLIQTHSPVVMNGINPFVTRPDLLDRSICIVLKRLKTRLTEKELEQAIADHSPVIFAGLLDLFVRALKLLPDVEDEGWSLPRMADFALLGEAMTRALGHAPGFFIELYSNHRRGSIQRVIDASPVAAAIVNFIQRGNTFNGTVGQLLEQLSSVRQAHESSEFWPKSARGLGDAIRRYSPALSQIGILAEVESQSRRDGVHCQVRKLENAPKPSMKSPENALGHSTRADVNVVNVVNNNSHDADTRTTVCPPSETAQIEWEVF
jgi:hypothetical protein